MGEHGRVLHTGQAIADIVMEVDALPEPGGDTYSRATCITAGGGFNVMAAAARDGAEVVYLGSRGTGTFADIVAAALREEGIATPAPPIADMDTGYCVALVDATAERTFISSLGAEGHSNLQTLNGVHVSEADIVYVTGYSFVHDDNREALVSWLPTLPTATRVIFDTAPLVDQIPQGAFDCIRRRADLWTLNVREAGLVLRRRGAGGGPSDDVAHVAEAVANSLAAPVLLRSGARGTAYATPGQAARHFPAPKVNAIDTNGAGDAHTGVLMAALTRGETMDSAIRRANAAAALAVTRRGPATSPRGEDIDRLLKAAT